MTNFIKSLLSFGFAISSFVVLAQDSKQEKMAQLSYLIGEWVGTTTSYENGEITKQGPAFESIQYDLDSSILVIQLNTEFLQLHTIIYYSEKDQTYYYQPFSKNGTGTYPASFKDGMLIVQPTDSKRYIFTSTAEGGFKEYGEELIDGVWVKYFEDVFTDTQ
ncbi:MAG: hypothetical protein HRT74_11660 [Flavobacteriales bacterium]|nr:hypothetical protein [Flavobacteriales bacterium]